MSPPSHFWLRYENMYGYEVKRKTPFLQHPHLHLNSSCFGYRLYWVSLMYKHTLCCRAKEGREPFRNFKQKDIFRKVLLSEETKGGSEMTSHTRESEGHWWQQTRLWNCLTNNVISHTQTHSHTLTHTYTHTHRLKVPSDVLKIAVSLSTLSSTNFRIIQTFGIHLVFPLTCSRN